MLFVFFFIIINNVIITFLFVVVLDVWIFVPLNCFVGGRGMGLCGGGVGSGGGVDGVSSHLQLPEE